MGAEMNASKRCPNCEETKPLSEFYAVIRDGVSCWCKPCSRWRQNAANARKPKRNVKRALQDINKKMKNQDYVNKGVMRVNHKPLPPTDVNLDWVRK